MATTQDIVRAITQRDGIRVVCIDGPAGAGKTTLSEVLLEQFPQALLIHMDDLYDGWVDALDSRLTQRLVDSIITPLTTGAPLQIQTYDWHEERFGETVTLPYSDVVIIEGVGAAQTSLREIASVTVWVDVDEHIGKERVLRRDGDAVAPFIDDWQRQEKSHHEEHKTKASCHFVVTFS